MEEVQIAALVLNIIQQASALYAQWQMAQAADDINELRLIESKLAAQNDALMK